MCQYRLPGAARYRLSSGTGTSSGEVPVAGRYRADLALANDVYRQGGHEVVKDLVTDDFVASGVGPQMNGNNAVPGGPFGARGILYHQHALLGLLSKQKVARNGFLLGVGEVHRVVGLENDEFEVDFLAHQEEGSWSGYLAE